ncbi:MAG: trimethylamine methyltransferase family protein [Fimbriimonadaceae bacterium]|nr:trimethylamine methyltransferase family protein [Fimbriimonadaceae bacterium]
MFARSLLTDSQAEALGAGLLRVLDEVGVVVQNDALLECLVSWGARVDRAAQRATFPPALVVQFLDQLRGQPQSAEAAPRWATGGQPALGTQIAQLLYQWPSGERVSGRRQLLAELVRFGEALHPAQGVGHCLLCTDVPPLLEPLAAGLVLAEWATLPHPPFAWNVAQIDWLCEMGELLGRPHWYNWGAICIAHPLRFDRDIADKYLRRCREGVATGVTAMPVAGMTTPLTTAGFCAVAGAEIVAGWLLARAVNPTVGLSGSIWAGSLDMKSGEVSYSSFDALFNGFVLHEFLRRYTGRNVPVGGGEYCDAREPGYYAVWEKAHKALLITAFTGRGAGLGEGLLENGKTLCLEQLLLERDVSGGLDRLAAPVDTAPTELDWDAVLRVGTGAAHHLGEDTSLLRFRELAWCPPFYDRSGWRGAATDQQVLAKCHQEVVEQTAAVTTPRCDEATLAALRAVVDRARTALLP